MKKIIILSILLIFNFVQTISNAEIKTVVDGDKNAKIKLIIFESLTCSHCANFHKDVYPNLKTDFLDTGYASIEYRSFPLDMAALNASKIAHCKNDGNSEILHLLYNNQKEWAKGDTIEAVNKNIKTVIEKLNFNINIDKCINDTKIEDHILEDRIEGVKKFKVQATPTLIINGKKFENPTNYKKLKKYLEKLI